MVNKVILIGNVGADPVVRYLEGGVAVAHLSLATTEVYKNKDGNRVEQTEWHNVVFWRGLAQIVEAYVKKGTLLYVEGKIKSRSWEDQAKVKHYITEIYSDTMQILTRGKGASDPPIAPAPRQTGTTAAPEMPEPNSPTGTGNDTGNDTGNGEGNGTGNNADVEDLPF
ncbi:MAG: single-stranded DNA-binding protein [Odoribacteraceae bacterium]|jgi:single-strand DNA-binding protein|nr:single-stranded DNA-binding protein [Odoribacteraceae bacterium]